MAKKAYDYLFNVLLIGDQDVGKTKLLLRFSDGDALNTAPVSRIGTLQNLSWVEQGLTSHQTHYRSYRARVLCVKWPNQQCQSTEGRQALKIRLQSHQGLKPNPHRAHHNTHTDKHKSTHSEIGPVWHKTQSREVRTAHLSVLMTVHSFSTQYKTEQFW